MKKSRKIISLILAAVMLLAASCLISGCSKFNEGWVPAGFKLASTDAVDYKLYVPESWTVDISTGTICAYVSDSDRSNITMAAMNLKNDDAVLTVDEYWAKYESDLVSTFPTLRFVDIAADGTENEDAEAAEKITGETQAEETEAPTFAESGDHCGNPVNTLLGGMAAKKYYYTATVTGIDIEYMQVICIRGGIVYIFTYTAIPQNFDYHMENVEKILENFSFED